MGITKSLMNTGSRAIFNRMSELFKDSPRLQGLVAKGADLISPNGPDKANTSNALVDLFKRKGLTLLQDQLSNGSKAGFVQSLLSNDNAKSGFLMKAAFVVAPVLAAAVTVLGKLTSALKEASVRPHNQTPLGDLIKAGETATPAAATTRSPADEKVLDLEWEIQLAKDVGRGLQANLDKAKSTPGVHPGLIADFESQIADNTRKLQQKQTEHQALQNPSEPARAGTDLMSLLQINSVPITQTHSNVDAAFEDWTRSEKASRAEFGHAERQLHEALNIVHMLRTDLRNNPGNSDIEQRLKRALENSAKAQELHMQAMDKQFAILEKGRSLGQNVSLPLTKDLIPEDWNRPKTHIPKIWNQSEEEWQFHEKELNASMQKAQNEQLTAQKLLEEKLKEEQLDPQNERIKAELRPLWDAKWEKGKSLNEAQGAYITHIEKGRKAFGKCKVDQYLEEKNNDDDSMRFENEPYL